MVCTGPVFLLCDAAELLLPVRAFCFACLKVFDMNFIIKGV